MAHKRSQERLSQVGNAAKTYKQTPLERFRQWIIMLVLQSGGNSSEKIIRGFRLVERNVFLCKQSEGSMKLSNATIILLCLVCLSDLG